MSVSHADKQKIAVLGLEAVVGANGQIDPADTKFAKELTAELRARANNSKNFSLTKDQRELVDEKLMNNCASEQAQCMGPIGASMGADVLLFGKVANAKGGYKVSLTLVDVRKKTVIGTDPNSTITTADTKNPNLGSWVREHYKKLTGEGGDGVLIITAVGANAGRILVNGDTRDTLKSGRAEVSLPEGRYRIGVEADGFKLWEQEGVTVSSDKPTELKPDLVRSKPVDVVDPGNNTTEPTTTGTENLISREGTVSPKKSKTMWKVAAGVGLGGAAIAGGFWIYSYTKVDSFSSEKVPTGVRFENASVKDVTPEHCSDDFKPIEPGNMTHEANAKSINDKFDTACKHASRTKWLVPTTIGLAALGAGALIYLMVSSDSTESAPAGTTGRRAKKKRNLIVTPVVTPDNTGATLRFDW
ncbi:MAG: carboxypeptidase-like regulatory domain-containing protein [Myxococcota bacterium]|nr:hypothetical protein [Deltaproteobacteria bacterium]MDQ3338513.1 carboxypeptidase-like regulatory domain-containing protein [Myxococcota bacterium]